MSDSRISFGKLFWPSFLAVFIAGLVGMVFFFLVLGGIIGSFGDFGPEPLALRDKTVLHVQLAGTIQDVSEASFDPTALRLNRINGLPEILLGLREAAKDSKIKGIFLEMKSPEMGMATAQEIRDALSEFQKSGKFIVAYLSGEETSLLDYYLSSVCNEVYGMYGTTFLWSGLHAESFYFKNLLDELQIGVTVVRGKENDFKSAVEPFYRTEMSDSSELQMKVILTDLWAQSREQIAISRQIDSNMLDTLAQYLKVRNLTQAASYQLIDKNLYRGEVLAILKKKVGLDESTPLRLQAFGKYARETFHDNQLLARQEKHIAVILAEGDVEAEGNQIATARMTKLLRQARDNDKVKAVVLRINSTGGSALASEEIWREVSLTAMKKTLYVSMGDYAASGGYFIAMPAMKIFADASTITGSIGVFGVVPYVGDFLQNKLGINTQEISTHQYGKLSPTHKLTDREYAMMQIEVDEVYRHFIERVKEGRKMTIEEIHQVARGRIWSGLAAQKVGLIDEIGGLEATINALRKKTNISEVVFYPQKEVDPFSNFLELLDEELETENTKIAAQIPEELVLYYQKYTQIKKMKGLQMRLPFVLSIY